MHASFSCTRSERGGKGVNTRKPAVALRASSSSQNKRFVLFGGACLGLYTALRERYQSDLSTLDFALFFPMLPLHCRGRMLHAQAPLVLPRSGAFLCSCVSPRTLHVGIQCHSSYLSVPFT